MRKLSERQRERIKAQMQKLYEKSIKAETLPEQMLLNCVNEELEEILEKDSLEMLLSYDYEGLEGILEKDSLNRAEQTQEDIWHLSQGWKKWWRK